MNNVVIHDLYIHATSAEGMYIGNTSYNPDQQHRFNHLQIYDNRVIRTGAEALQVSHVGDDTEIHHNVFLGASVD